MVDVLLKVSVTKLLTWLRCRMKYYYRYILNLKKKVIAVAPARGSIIHTCLEAHYKGQPWVAALERWQQDTETNLLPFMTDEQRAEWETIPRDVYRIVQGYLRAFTAHDQQFDVLAVEHEDTVELPSGITLEYRLDRLLREKATDMLFILDSKSIAQIPTDNIRFTDVQSVVYIWAHAKRIGKDIAGLIWDYIRTKAPVVPKLLQKGGLSRDKSIDTDWPTYLAAIQANGLNPVDYEDMRAILAEKAFYKRVKQAKPVALMQQMLTEVDYTSRQIQATHKLINDGRSVIFPRTLLHSCSWDCEFAELCFAQLAGQSGEWIINASYEPRTRDDKDIGTAAEVSEV